MRVLTRSGTRPRTIRSSQASGTSEALLADQASGCGRFTAKKIFIDREGRTACFGSGAGSLIVILEGTVEAASPDGGIETLGPGEGVVLAPGERCRLFNHGNVRAVALRVKGNP